MMLQERLDDKLSTQHRMKQINKIVKAKKLTAEQKIARLSSEFGISDDNARRLLSDGGFSRSNFSQIGREIKEIERKIEQVFVAGW